jgi:hypothetical protein
MQANRTTGKMLGILLLAGFSGEASAQSPDRLAPRALEGSPAPQLQAEPAREYCRLETELYRQVGRLNFDALELSTRASDLIRQARQEAGIQAMRSWRGAAKLHRKSAELKRDVAELLRHAADLRRPQGQLPAGPRPCNPEAPYFPK